MNFDKNVLDELSARAKESPRLRMNFDLRNSPEDTSQRMLNAIEPGSEVPIHRHQKTSETVVVLRGRVVEEFYDELGVREIEFETYYDHCLACRVVEHKVGKPQKIILD